MSATQQTISDSQFEKLRTIIYDRSGIWFADSKRYVLESRLSRRLEELNMDSFDQYVMFLSIGPYGSDEFQEMFNRITINETSFFRNAPQLDVFEKSVLPVLLTQRAATRRLRIWSVACSSGEEPYTLAIQIHRTLGIRLGDWHVEILGIDLSERVLIQAQKGLYTDYAMRGVDPLVKSRYFKQTAGGYEIDPTIKSMVTFDRQNLKDTLALKRFGTWDVIFCRNVMIYFDQPMRDGCLKLFHQQLADDGTLFIGHSETIRDESMFIARAEPQAFAYNKNKGSI